jgi:hypothetical protein
MGLLDFLFKKNEVFDEKNNQYNSEGETNNIHAQMKDKRKPECPCCGKVLKKIPGRKTCCPSCHQFMFVRTRPKTLERVVVTEIEANKIDSEWALMPQNISSGSFNIQDRERYEDTKKKLQLKFNRMPSDNDIKWSILNTNLLEFSKKGDWGLYRNARFDMAELLRKENKLEASLRCFLEIYYLDLNGPTNDNDSKDKELLEQFPPFNTELGFTAPVVLGSIKGIVENREIKKEELKLMFFDHNNKISNALKLPLSADICWNSLEKEIWK